MFKRWKPSTLALLLVGLTLAGPLIAYAGIQVIYSESVHTVQSGGTPPISFGQGTDYSLAVGLGVASGLTIQDSGASFLITLNAISGGNVTIDKYVFANRSAGVASFKMQLATELAGGLNATEIALLKIRLWTGGVAPTADNSAGVCGVLDLEASANTESAACTSASNFVQVIFDLAPNASGTSTVAIRPSSIA